MSRQMKCPARDCQTQIPDSQFLCGVHLKLCPDALQRKVYRLNREMWQGRDGNKYKPAVQEAIEAVYEAELSQRREVLQGHLFI